MSDAALQPCGAAAMILAGGRGSRLQSVVSDRPKVLAEVCGRPFLSYLLDQLAAAGFAEAILCTGFMASSVAEAFGGTYKGLRLRYSPEDRPLGTAGALRLALPLVKSPAVLVMNGDSICDADLTDFWNRHFSAGAAAILLTQVPDASRYGRVDVAESGQVRGFEEKGWAGPGCINAGVYVLSRRVLEDIPAGAEVSLERQVFPSLIGKGLFGQVASGRFLDIGTPESYRQAEKILTSWKPKTGRLPGMYAPRTADNKTQVRAGVGIAIYDSHGRILLERRSDCGWWGLPGGRIDPGESIADTVVREAFEETGLRVRIKRLIGVYSGPAGRIVTFPERVVQLVDVIVEAEIVSGELKISDESLEMEYFDLNSLPADIVPPARAILEDLRAGKTGVIG